MIRMQHQRAGGGERPLRLPGGRVELDLLAGVGRLRRQLVDVLAGDRHERRLRVGGDVRLRDIEIRHLAVKSLDIASAPLSPYLTPLPSSVPVACSSRPLPVTVASTLAMPERLSRTACRSPRGSACRRERQVRLARVVERQRAARLHVEVAPDDLELRISPVGRDSRRRDSRGRSPGRRSSTAPASTRGPPARCRP